MNVDIKLSPAQSIIFQDPARFRVCVSGRRFGKTYLGCVILFIKALKPNSYVWYISPTYKQVKDAKDGAFPTLKRIIPEKLIKRINETDFVIELKNGSTIQCRSGDTQQQNNLRGGGIDFLVLDEYAELDPQIWTLILQPKIADTKGGVLFIGTPKGYTHFYDLYRDASRGFNSDNVPMKDWAAYQYTTLDGGRVDRDEIERLKSIMSTSEFEQEFLAKFTALSGRVYTNFDGNRNYIKPGTYRDDGSPLLTGWDFNTGPTGISIVVAQKQNDTIYVLKAINFPGLTTTDAANKLLAMYPNRIITAFPDPAGGKLNTTGVTDFSLLRKAGLTVKGNDRHTPIKDRVNNTQANLLSADGRIRILINEKDCEPLIKTLAGQVYDDDGQPNKEGGLDHMGDAFGYLLWWCSNLFRGSVQQFSWSPM